MMHTSALDPVFLEGVAAQGWKGWLFSLPPCKLNGASYEIFALPDGRLR